MALAKESALINKVWKDMKGEKEARVIGTEKPVVSDAFDQELPTVEAGFVATFTS